ncbi:MAG: hypothetical protein ACLR9W_03065 [Enterobacter hormaechei]
MQVNLDKLTVAALEGKTELTALLDWQQAISWRGELKLTGINTAKEVPDWPSKLDGLIKTAVACTVAPGRWTCRNSSSPAT